MRLAHGWRLAGAEALEFLRPVVRAVPGGMARRLGSCSIQLTTELGEHSSEWTAHPEGLEVTLATEGIDGHELAIELLLVLGEALWERATDAEREAWWKLLAAEIEAGAPGELDEDSRLQKHRLLRARSGGRWERYARTAFAATAAEYVHCLWHDVSVRTGPEDLPPQWLRLRLELLARWFPPNRGYRLFAVGQSS